MKKLLVGLLSTLVFSVSFLSTKLYVASQSFDYPRSVVHKVEAANGGHGSGVMLAPNLMITAFHVTGPEGAGIKVDGKPIKVLKFDRDLDVSLIWVEKGCPCIPLHPEVPVPDTRVLAVGFPLNVEQVATLGQTSTIVDKWLISTANTTFGNSGGGLFMWNGYHWVLVGVTVNIAGANLGFIGIPVFHLGGSVPSASILKWLHRSQIVN